MPTPIEAATEAILVHWYHYAGLGVQEKPEFFASNFAKASLLAAVRSMNLAEIIDPSIVEPERSKVIEHMNASGLNGEAEMRELERRAEQTAGFIERELLSGF